MVEATKPSKDLRVRNVSLHSRGKTENGTLYLTRHHLIFSYLPETGSRAASVSHGPAADSNARLGVSLDSTTHRDSNDSTTRHSTSTPRPRMKEVWVPYPMINHCVLRPSHSQSTRTYDYDMASETEDAGSDESSFPPVFGTNAYDRPSTDSARLAPYASPLRSASPNPGPSSTSSIADSGRVPALRIRRRDFQMMAFHFHPSSLERPPDEAAREVFFCLRTRCCVETVQNMHAFHFKAPQEEIAAGEARYDARREFTRMGVGGKAAEGPGSAWRLSEINRDYSYSPTYPGVLCVPRAVSDNLLKYGGVFRSKARIPALTYLHPNGGSITRSSQPMVGIGSKRNPQDERLVTAIFSSHTPLHQSPTNSPPLPPSTNGSSVLIPGQTDPEAAENVPGLSLSQSDTALNEKYSNQESVPRKRIYGSTRRNVIVDARPRVNALANRATGGGIEDVANYAGPSGIPVERIFLDIANIHVMRKSLDKVIESFANSDYLDLKPNQELLRSSGWLAHIGNLLEGAELVARVVGLGGSHVLVHCSDGWDRTSQVAALAEVMLDPYYRSLDGFITLVQKDFLAFGHKFNHRHGIQGSEKWFEIENERVTPTRPKNASGSEATGFNKALSGAKNWFDKNRTTLFRQQNENRSENDSSESRPPSPPPNAVLRSPPTTNTKDDREHKTDTKEIAPIFHQFLDAVFQLQYQNPKAFEFNERFLRRLFYQAHSGQYGEFLFNNEQDRARYEEDFSSVWPHFLSRRQEFLNPGYVAKVDDPLLFPTRHASNREIEVKWWSALFGRKDGEMNTPRALAPPDPRPNYDSLRLSADASSISLGTGGSETPEKAEAEVGENIKVKEAKSVPSFEAVRNTLSSTFASFQLGQTETAAQQEEKTHSAPERPTLEQRETDTDVLTRYTNVSSEGQGSREPQSTVEIGSSSCLDPDVQRQSDGGGDPLGVSGGSNVQEVAPGRLDFSQFAQQNAFRDR